MKKIQGKRIQWKNFNKAKEISAEIEKIEVEIEENNKQIPSLEDESLLISDSLDEQKIVFKELKTQNDELRDMYLQEQPLVLVYEENDLGLLLDKAYVEEDKKNIALIGMELKNISGLKSSFYS